MRRFFVSFRAIPAYHVRLYWPVTRGEGLEPWVATFEELPGCLAQGASMAEAEATLWHILPGYLKQLRRRRVPLPDPVFAADPSIEGMSVVMAPSGLGSRPSDPGATAPIAAPGEVRSASGRADIVLLGS